jgi:hypothetical protein
MQSNLDLHLNHEIASHSDSKLRLSQGQLNLLETCPRKFQHIYLEQLGSPTTPEQQAHQAWGSRFHLLMQQRELGLPIEALMAADDQMQSLSLIDAAAGTRITH